MKWIDQDWPSLLDAVIEQMKVDIASDDWTAIEDLLKHTPKKYLVGFLSEGEDPTDYVGMGWVGSDGKP